MSESLAFVGVFSLGIVMGFVLGAFSSSYQVAKLAAHNDQLKSELAQERIRGWLDTVEDPWADENDLWK